MQGDLILHKQRVVAESNGPVETHNRFQPLMQDDTDDGLEEETNDIEIMLSDKNDMDQQILSKNGERKNDQDQQPSAKNGKHPTIFQRRKSRKRWYK